MGFKDKFGPTGEFNQGWQRKTKEELEKEQKPDNWQKLREFFGLKTEKPKEEDKNKRPHVKREY